MQFIIKAYTILLNRSYKFDILTNTRQRREKKNFTLQKHLFTRSVSYVFACTNSHALRIVSRGRWTKHETSPRALAIFLHFPRHLPFSCAFTGEKTITIIVGVHGYPCTSAARNASKSSIL